MLFPTEYTYLLNIAVVFIVLLFAYSGYRQGFLLKLIGILGFTVCSVLAWGLSSPLCKLVKLFPKDMTPMADTIAGPLFYDSINRVLVFLVLFVLLGILVIILKPLLKAVGKLPVIQEVNTIFGALFGALQGIVIVMVLSFAFSTPLFANGMRVIDDSFLKPVNALGETLLFFADDSIEELKSIQKIVTPSTTLDDSDVQHIRDWLLRYDLDEPSVNAFLQELTGDKYE